MILYSIIALHNLTLKNGAATLTDFTLQCSRLKEIIYFLFTSKFMFKIFCGGGRKNNFLVEKIRE